MDYYIQPDGTPFLDKPVVLLSSTNTASAADVCAMVLKTLPNVALIGERTNGMFSNVLRKNLPNGWVSTLSNESYTAADDIDYE